MKSHKTDFKYYQGLLSSDKWKDRRLRKHLKIIVFNGVISLPDDDFKKSSTHPFVLDMAIFFKVVNSRAFFCNLKNTKGQTLLHIVVKNKHNKYKLKWLLKHGVSWLQRDKQGMLPIHICVPALQNNLLKWQKTHHPKELKLQGLMIEQTFSSLLLFKQGFSLLFEVAGNDYHYAKSKQKKISLYCKETSDFIKTYPKKNYFRVDRVFPILIEQLELLHQLILIMTKDLENFSKGVAQFVPKLKRAYSHYCQECRSIFFIFNIKWISSDFRWGDKETPWLKRYGKGRFKEMPKPIEQNFDSLQFALYTLSDPEFFPEIFSNKHFKHIGDPCQFLESHGYQDCLWGPHTLYQPGDLIFYGKNSTIKHISVVLDQEFAVSLWKKTVVMKHPIETVLPDCGQVIKLYRHPTSMYLKLHRYYQKMTDPNDLSRISKKIIDPLLPQSQLFEPLNALSNELIAEKALFPLAAKLKKMNIK